MNESRKPFPETPRSQRSTEITKAQRDEILARRERQQQETGPAAGRHEMLTFDGRCRWCADTFQYQGPGFIMGDGKAVPLMQPLMACERVQCREKSNLERRTAREAEERETSRLLEERTRTEYARWVPDLYHCAAPDGHRALASHVLPELQSWHPTKSLYLHGTPGSGKSHQLAALMHHVAGRYTMEWYSSRRLIADAQAAISSKKRERPSIFAEPLRPQVLVLNDLFAERSTEYAVAEVGNLIDARYEAGLPVAATGNYRLSEAAEKSDNPLVRMELERIAGRLLQMTTEPKGTRLRMAGHDWRTAMAMAQVNA